MFWKRNKDAELKKKLRKVLMARYIQTKSLDFLKPRMDDWSQGYLQSQEELYAELINILDGEIPILDPKG